MKQTEIAKRIISNRNKMYTDGISSQRWIAYYEKTCIYLYVEDDVEEGSKIEKHTYKEFIEKYL